MMQQIATSKSDVAALPVNVGSTERSSDPQNEAFRSMLREQDAMHQKPVEPKVKQVEKAQPNKPEASNQVKDSENKPTVDKSNKVDEQAEASTSDEVANENRAAKKDAQQSKQPEAEEKTTASSNIEETAVDGDEKEDDVDWLALLNQIQNAPISRDKNIKQEGQDSENISDNAGKELVSEIEAEQQVAQQGQEQSTDNSEDDSLAKLLLLLEQLSETGEDLEFKDEDLMALYQQLFETGLALDKDKLAQLTTDDKALLQDLLTMVEQYSSEDGRQLPLPIAAGEGEKEPVEEFPIAPSLAALIKLPEEKLDKALKNLANRLEAIVSSDGAKSTVNSDAEKAAVDRASQQANLFNDDNVEQKLTGLLNAEQKSEFVASLKAGIQEFKAQLQQGREPGLDLKAMVAQSLASATSEGQVSKNSDAVDAVLSKFGQALDLGQQLSNSLDAGQRQQSSLEVRLNADANMRNQVESAKQSQQQMASLERSVNLARPEGQQQLVEKVRWISNQNNLQAEIRLDPPELGSMKVKVNLSGESASVNFVVQSQGARDVLEQATPRLKEMLEEQGIELGQSSVQEEQTDNQTGDEQLAGGSGQSDENMGDEQVVSEQRITNGRIGGIDYFV